MTTPKKMTLDTAIPTKYPQL